MFCPTFFKTTLSGFLLSLSVLHILDCSKAAIPELGHVKCTVFINFSKIFHEAHSTCWEKREKETKAEDKKDAKEDKLPYPVNATIEEFEWDDKCMEHCVYETLGMLGKDGALPDKSDTTKLFGKGKVSEERYNLIVSAWNECLELSGKIGKEKKWNKCKVVTHHDHCFQEKLFDVIKTTEIEC